jgi:RAB protein geranylgeranyltransferase component A
MAEADSFDVIVVGSGLASSVFAAAMARSGKRVVHLDERDYYGADWGTLPLRDFFRWVQASSTPVEGAFDYAVRIPAPFQASPFKQCYSASCRAGRGRCYSPTCTTAPWQASWTNALKNDRRFQIDLR